MLIKVIIMVNRLIRSVCSALRKMYSEVAVMHIIYVMAARGQGDLRYI